MIRILAILFCLSQPLAAQEFSALATVDAAQSGLRDDGKGLALDLHLSIAVPYRVFTLDQPRRVVLDFREIDWQGVRRTAMLNADNASDVRFGPLRPGWSRMVIDLAAPMSVQAAGMQVDPQTRKAVLELRLVPTNEEAFAQAAGAPQGDVWDELMATVAQAPVAVVPDGPPIVAIDAGHGGIDPGAQRGGVREADLMLQIAFGVVDAINRTGQMRAFLIRDDDYFVPLEDRMTRARQAGAMAFISLHADALEGGGADGASVYTLSKDAVDLASRRMAERHERGDLLAGVDLTGQADRVASVLMDLARLETGPSGQRLADALIDGMDRAGVQLNKRPHRHGDLAVLTAADFASVLVEVGFLSSDADRARLLSPQGQSDLAAGITAGLLAWIDDEAARAPLLRQ